MNTNPYDGISLRDQERKVSKLIEEISSYQDSKNCTKLLPPHLEQFKRDMEAMELSNIQLPIRSTLSPKMKIRLASLPTPTDDETKKAINYTKEVQHLGGISAYKELINSTDKSRARKHKLNENDISHIEHIINSSSKRSIPSDFDLDDSSTEYYRKMQRIKKRKAEIQAKVEAANSPTPSSRGNNDGRPLSPFGSGLSVILGSAKPPSNKFTQLPKLSSTPIQQNSNLDAYLSSIKKQIIMDTDISPKRQRESIVSSSLSIVPSSSSLLSANISVSKSMTSLRQSNSAASDRNDNNINSITNSEDSDSINTKLASKVLSNLDPDISRSMNNQILSPINRKPPPKNAPQPMVAAFEAVNNSMKVQQRSFTENESMKEVSSKNNKKFLDSLKSNLYDQLGLDIDKNFTKRRLYSKGFRTLVYFTYNFKIKEAFTWLTSQVKRDIAMRRAFASLVLTRLGRGMNARTRVRQIKTAIRLRKEAEALKLLKAKEAIIIGSHVITRFVRYVGKSILDIKNAYTMQSRVDLQRIARGFIARRRYKRLAEINRIRIKSIIIIQCFYRQRLARRKVVLFRKMRSVYLWLRNIQAEKQAIRTELQRQGAATCISRYYRAYKIRVNLARLIFWHRWEVAISFQKLFRGHIQRKAFRKALRLRREKQRKRRVATTNIQRLIRGYISRKYRSNPLKVAKIEKRNQYLAIKREILDRDKKEETWQDWLEKNHPMKHIKEWNNAILIQKVYRGHKGKTRAFVIMINARIQASIALERRKNYGASLLQKIVRGYLYRIKRFRAHKLKMVFVLQCAWRCFVARKTLRLRKREYDATEMISRNMAAFFKKRQYNKLREERRKFNKYARTIQMLFRLWQGRNLWNHRKYEIRAEREKRDAAAFEIESFMAHIQLKMLLESLDTPMGSNVPSQTKKAICPCKGPIQALFVGILGVKGRYDDKALITNKMDAITFQKFIYRVKGVMINAPKQKKYKGGTPKLILLRHLLAGGFTLPTGCNALSPTELDLLFNKIKAETESDGLLDFDGFLKLMTEIAEVHFKPKEGSTKRRAAPSLNNQKYHEANDRKFAVLISGEEAAEVTRSTNETRLSMIVDKRIVSGEDSDSNLLLAFIIKCLVSIQDERFYDQIKLWMNYEVEDRLLEYARLMAVVYRRRKAKLWRAYLAERRRMRYIQDNLFNTVACIQKYIRRFISIRRQGHVAQKFLIKYIPHTGQPYWYNPSTRVASEKKPKILRNYDSVSIALPPEGLANTVKCSNCPSPAQVNCIQCEDSFCKRCFDNVHCKGQRKSHNYVSILYCSNCKYQVGCKNCLTCILNKPAPGSLQASMKESERGTLCDTCFTHFHDPMEISLTDPKFANRKKAERTLMMRTKEAYLVGQQIHQRVVTDHRYDNLVEPCEECQWRSATWRCDDCNQIYCHSCLTGLHSIGGPFSKHRAETLPYYTPEMHANYILSYKEQRMHDRMNVVIRAAQEAREQFKSQSIVKLQTWWRRIYYAKDGHRLMRIARLKKRKIYRERKRDETARSNTKYKLLDIVGKAPALKSDTKEEKVLKRLPAWWRQRAREYIWKNQVDWGFFRVSSTDPQKGTPKQGFSVGTVSELIDQAKKGGYRLPGKVSLQMKQNTHNTAIDLSNLVKPGMIVRISDMIFCIRSVTDSTITLDRRWYKADSEELIFKMPSFKDEKYSQYYRWKYNFSSGLVNNFVGQLYYKTYYSYHMGILKMAVKQMKECKKKKKTKMMNEWKATALNSQRCANRALCYISDEIADANLSEQQEDNEEIGDDVDKEAAKAIKKAKKGLDPNKEMSKAEIAELLESAPDDETRIAIAKTFRKPGERYYPIQAEITIRYQLEDEMTKDELIATVDNWLIERDIKTNNIIYINKETLEMTNEEPRCFNEKRLKDIDDAAKKKSYDEAKKKMEAIQNASKAKKKF